MDGTADSPKAALDAYIRELEQEYQPWYEASTKRWRAVFGIGRITALLAGVLAAVLAAAANQTLIDDLWFRGALVVLPLLSSFAGSLMTQSRARELLTLREHGRAKIQDIISRAKADYAAALSDPKKLTSVHIALVAEVDKLENSQADGFLSMAGADSEGADSG